MNSVVLFLSCSNSVVSRGNVFRVPAKYPYEDLVDFMVFETGDGIRPYGLMVSSGYKAGLTLVHLPQESVVEGGVSKQWLVENWSRWIYPDCEISNVYFFEGYIVSPLE